MSDPQQVLDILRDARELVQNDWTTTNLEVSLEEAGGRHCASLAIRSACNDDFDETRAAHIAFLVGAGIHLPTDTDIGSIYGLVFALNDAQTSRAPVVATFDKAIAMLKPPEPRGEET